MMRLFALAAIGMAFLCHSCRSPGSPGQQAATHPPRQDRVVPAPRERRIWQDEIVYVVVIQKFFNGDRQNDVMLGRFGKDRSRFEGGFWGGDLEGVIQKLDYLTSLGVTTLLLYPVMDNDGGPFGKYLATGYRPRDYFRVDENFGNMATLRRLIEGAHQRGLRVILDLPLGMPGSEHPFQTDPQKQSWFGKVDPLRCPSVGRREAAGR